MTAVPIGKPGYISKAPPWSKSMFKMGQLGFPPGHIPPHLRPFLLKSGEVRAIASHCKAEGKTGASMVRCINTGVALSRGRGGRRHVAEE
jgi:hypothetical protein